MTYNSLRDELIHFEKNWEKWKTILAESCATSYSLKIIEEEDIIEPKINPESENITCKSCKNSVFVAIIFYKNTTCIIIHILIYF